MTLREGLEAALIVGIVLGVLRKLGYADRSRTVWAGVLMGIFLKALFGYTGNRHCWRWSPMAFISSLSASPACGQAGGWFWPPLE